MIFVTGVSGHLGRAIFDILSERGPDVRGGTRTVRAGESFVEMDFDLPETIDFSGVDTLVFVSAGAAEDDVVVARHARAIEAAERDGVRHVVYTSLVAAGDHLSIALPHRWTERRLEAGSVPWTVLRNGLYAELFGELLALGTVSDTDGGRMIASPFGHGELAAVSRRDLAEVAAGVALDPAEHAGKTYELGGTRAIGAADVAAVLGVDYRPGTIGWLRKSVEGSGVEPVRVERMLSIHSGIAQDFLAKTVSDLPALLGRTALDPLLLAVEAAGA